MLRIYIMFMLVGICLVLMIFSYITDSMPKRRRYLLSLMAFFAIVLLISDRVAYHYNGITSTTGIVATRVCKFLAYGVYYVIIYIFNQHIKDLLDTGVKRPPKSLKIVEYELMTGVILLIISQFTGLYYTYDSQNQYQRSPGYVVSYIVPMTAIAIQLAVIIRCQHTLRKKMLVPLVTFTLMPFLAAILQFFIHGTSLTGIFIVGMIVLLYCFSILDTNDLIRLAHQAEIDNLLEKQRNINLMVEQTTFALVEAIDAKDSYTNGHSKRVADYSKMIAKKAGKTDEECDKIHLIAMLHDVGKIGIPDAIINKNGSLTDDEYSTIKSHPKVGREILSKITISPELSIGASFHHERYDGKGYPFGLRGDEIPEIARIIAVADTYDAMASKRSYRGVLPKDVIKSELEKGIDTQFDPQFARIMLGLIDSGEV